MFMGENLSLTFHLFGILGDYHNNRHMILETSTSTYPSNKANTSYHRWSPLILNSHTMSLSQISVCNTNCIVDSSTERRQIAQIRLTMERDTLSSERESFKVSDALQNNE